MTELASAFDLSGRGVAVTGGGGHLGRAIVLAVADAGATVVACGRTLAPLEAVRDEAGAQGLRGRVVPLAADITTDGGVEAVLDAVEAAVGTVDGWVNNAYAGAGGLLGEASQDEIETTLTSGLAVVIGATGRVAARMKPRGKGAIVNVASMYGIVSPQPDAYAEHPEYHNPPAYGAAKAGVIAFTRYAAVHLAGDGIRVNAISPGAFPGTDPGSHPEFVQALERRVPLGRVGAPSDIGPSVVYLLSDASGYVTGHNLVVDGGWTAW